MKWTQEKLSRLAEINKLTKIPRYFAIKDFVDKFQAELVAEIKVLATEPIWDKTKDIREAEIKTRTPKELCLEIDKL